MFIDFKSFAYLALVCVLTLLPSSSSAGGTPEDLKAFNENKAKAEAGEGFINDWSQQAPRLDFSGKPTSKAEISPGAWVANAYLSGIGVDRDESEALLWYFRVKGQAGLNDEAFKALIKSMPAAKIHAVIKRSRSEENEKFFRFRVLPPLPVDATFKPLGLLKASNSPFATTLDYGYHQFLSVSASMYHTRARLVEFNKFPESDYPYDVVAAELESLGHKPFSPQISFSQIASDADKAIFDAASARVKAKIDATIASPASADSSSLDLVAHAYELGHFGLRADPEQRNRWSRLALDARMAETRIRLVEADSSGSEVWLQIANELKWASTEVKEILTKDHDWGSRYVEVLTIKAEAGDLVSLDGLIDYYREIVSQGKGIRANSHESGQLIRWVSERHKLTKNSEDGIILAHHYFAQGRSDLARQMANQYLAGLSRNAKEGSLSAMLKMALLSDSNWYDRLEGDVESYSPDEIRPLYSMTKYNELYSFRDHGRLLKSFGYVGSNALIWMNGLHDNPFNFGGSAVQAQFNSRALLVRYVEAFVKFDASSGPLLEDLEEYRNFATVLRYLAEQDQLIADKYHEVKGGARDFESALRWHRLLADMGERDALMVIASSYEHGRGLPRDPASAYAYYAMAGAGPDGLMDAYQKTPGTNEQKLDACFKLTPAEKANALKIYRDFLDKLTARLERLAAKRGEEMLKRDLQAIRDYQAQKASKANPTKK